MDRPTRSANVEAALRTRSYIQLLSLGGGSPSFRCCKSWSPNRIGIDQPRKLASRKQLAPSGKKHLPLNALVDLANPANFQGRIDRIVALARALSGRLVFELPADTVKNPRSRSSLPWAGSLLCACRVRDATVLF